VEKEVIPMKLLHIRKILFLYFRVPRMNGRTHSRLGLKNYIIWTACDPVLSVVAFTPTTMLAFIPLLYFSIFVSLAYGWGETPEEGEHK
jgi:hypothetical protein